MINCVNEFSGVLGTVNPRSIGHPPKKKQTMDFCLSSWTVRTDFSGGGWGRVKSFGLYSGIYDNYFSSEDTRR